MESTNQSGWERGTTTLVAPHYQSEELLRRSVTTERRRKAVYFCTHDRDSILDRHFISVFITDPSY